MSDEEKLVSHYRLKTLLRRDGFGAVYLAEDTRDQKECVLRVIELDQATLARITGRVRARSQRDHPLIEQIRQRMKRISELKNSHILPVIEFGEEHIQGNNDIIFYMVSPYEKESLLTYWSAHTSSAELISLEIVVELISQAAEALYYVHRRGLVHQYVRLSSFMLRSTARSRRLHLYLTDFWFADITAALLEEGQIAQDLSVYLAAEQLAGHAGAASDQYALAILAYELLLGYRLSGVDLSLGLYERFVRQRGAEMSEAELALAQRLDLVLMRALAEDATARYQNIDEFASTFRSVAHGETVDLQEEETTKLAAIADRERRERRATEIAAAGAGALIAGELAVEADETQIEFDETTRSRRPGLHKTVLTSRGMEGVESGASSEIGAETVQSTSVVAGEETLTVIEDEKQSSSAGQIGAAGFAAGLVAGEALQSEASLSQEESLLAASSAAAFAAGEARQREIDLEEEHTRVQESSAAAFAAGAAAGLAAGEILGSEQETDIASEETRIIPATGGSAGAGGSAAMFAQEADISSEQTQIIPASGSGGAGDTLLAGGAGLVAGEMLAGGFGGASATGGAAGAGAATGSGGAAGGVAGSGIVGGAAGAGTVGGATGAGAAGGTLLAGTAGLAAGEIVAGGFGSAAGAGGAGAAGAAYARSRRRRRRWPLLAALLLVLLLIVITGIVYAFSPSSATVTLTLESHTIQNTYLVTATTSTTTISGQIQANLLTQTVTQSKSGQTSGYYTGAHATGFIKFYNSSTGCGCPIIIPAGTTFTGASGVTVVTDEAASVASLCYVTVHAHALVYGAGGDIPANDVQAAYNSKITAKNPYAFSGGQAGQSNSLVQQSDIARLATSLQAKVVGSAQAAIQAQVKSNQHLSAQPTCQTKTTSNHAVGDYASSVTVTVKATCTAEAYDYSAAVQIVQQQITAEASSYSSDQFYLANGLQTSVTSATVTDAKAGTLLLAIKAIGKWVRKFDDNQKSIYSHIIAGKSVDDARKALMLYSGIARVDFSISGRDPNTLPSDSSKITFLIRS